MRLTSQLVVKDNARGRPGSILFARQVRYERGPYGSIKGVCGLNPGRHLPMRVVRCLKLPLAYRPKVRT